MIGITRQQKECLDFVKSYLTVHGYSPCYDEIMAALGLKSRSGVHRLVTNLVVRGHLVRAPHKARSIALPGAAA